MSCSKAEGECKDGIPWLLFPESTSVFSRCVLNQKLAPQAKVLGQANRPLPQKDECVFQSAVLSVPCGWQSTKNCLSDCFSPKGPRNTSPWVHQSQVTRGYSLGSSHEN